mmetsp:Transcript_49763/g.78755  ORF Transcript_49763/g.78755 Transcript_49763/m.78755 type:complete len:124 (+) Transcript_49763:214-585(+)
MFHNYIAKRRWWGYNAKPRWAETTKCRGKVVNHLPSTRIKEIKDANHTKQTRSTQNVQDSCTTTYVHFSRCTLAQTSSSLQSFGASLDLRFLRYAVTVLVGGGKGTTLVPSKRNGLNSSLTEG